MFIEYFYQCLTAPRPNHYYQARNSLFYFMRRRRTVSSTKLNRELYLFLHLMKCVLFSISEILLHNFAKLRKIYFVPTLLHGPEDCNSAENVLTVHTVI